MDYGTAPLENRSVNIDETDQDQRSMQKHIIVIVTVVALSFGGVAALNFLVLGHS
jgi:hypothetical protein